MSAWGRSQFFAIDSNCPGPYSPAGPVASAIAATRFAIACACVISGLVSEAGRGIRSTCFGPARRAKKKRAGSSIRSEEHTSELQSLMRISYAVFCLKKKKNNQKYHINTAQKSHVNQ